MRFKPYVPIGLRRQRAHNEMARLTKKGHKVAPVAIEGRTIASTFWGKAWCDNLERYSDYANRLPRGRTYVRNGSVVDLQIASGKVVAKVSGTDLYTVQVKVRAVPETRWRALCQDCAGAIDSLVELLQGRFSKAVMERMCQQEAGLFPSPDEIEIECSCPDWASVCKHVAAVFYGIGARLDRSPELLFTLRNVDHAELIAKAGKGLPLRTSKQKSDRILEHAELSALFGIELAITASPRAATPAKTRKPSRKRAAKKRKVTQATRTRGSAGTRRQVARA